MKALLVWQMIPEEIQWFALDALSSDDLATLDLTHGQFLNTSGTPENVDEALDKVNAYLADPAGDYDEEFAEAEGFGKWSSKRVEEDALPTIGPIDKVYTCGFLL